MGAPSGVAPFDQHRIPCRLHLLVLDGPGPFIFDTIEIAASNMDSGESDALRQKVNQIFELHDCPWRISDGEFFKLDADFVGAKLAATGHNTLAANQFAGAELVPALDHMLISRFSQALYRYSIVVPMMVLVYSAAATTL